MTPTPALLRGPAWRRRRDLILNSCCDQGLSVPYSLASKSGAMLASRDVRASVPKYMTPVPKYIFRDTSHFQLVLFVEGSNSALGWCTMFVSSALQTLQERRQSAFARLRTGVPLFMVSQNGCRTLYKAIIMHACLYTMDMYWHLCYDDCRLVARERACRHVSQKAGGSSYTSVRFVIK